MRKWLPSTGHLWLWMLIATFIAIYLPNAASAEADINFKLKSVTLDNTKVLLHGEFTNDSKNMAKVTGLSIRYILSDEDGYPILTGRCIEQELDIPVSKTPVEHTIVTNNENAVVYSTNDVFFWRIETVVTVE